jgi:type II secretory pathway pseudopilin PulG
MIEIALSLAVIGFALVAIIGVLPTGMEVQKQNRQETIINQDATVWLDAIRNGQRGLDDLTNYVQTIMNYRTTYAYNPKGVSQSAFKAFTYTFTNAPAPEVVLTNGLNIVGLLSTPKYVPVWVNGKNIGFYSNYVVAYVRSLSGPASEKFPQTSADVRDLGLSYRMISEVIPSASYERDWTNFTAYQGSANTNDWIWRSNYWVMAKDFQADLNDLRLTFRWPYFYQNNTTGNGRQVFRTMAGGSFQTNNIGNPHRPETTLYFLQAGSYVTAP